MSYGTPAAGRRTPRSSSRYSPGVTGRAFVDALTARLGDRPIDVYPVNYPASLDFVTAADGVVDAGKRFATPQPNVRTPTWCSADIRNARP
jgi:hypothetical protein